MKSFIATNNKVLVEGLTVQAYVGLHAPERDELQTVVIDISCETQSPEVADDDLSNSADYLPVLDAVRDIAVSKKRRLIETFAEEIAEVCFAQEHVVCTTVSVRKPQKFPQVEAVGVTRTFTRA